MLFTILFISILFFVLSYHFINKPYTSIFLVLLGALLLRIYSSSYSPLGKWDERYHALVAKNLIKHPLKPTLYENPILPYNNENWTENHIWLSKPILPLWFLSASIYFFGNSEWSIRIPSLILSVLSVWLTFLIAKSIFNNIKIAWLASFFHAIHGLLIEVASGKISSDHIETAFLFFTEASVWFALLTIKNEKKHPSYAILCGITIGLAVMSKYLPGLLVLLIYPVLAFSHNKESFRKITLNYLFMMLSTGLVCLPWFIYCFNAFPKESQTIVYALIFPMQNIVQNHSGPWWYYIEQIRIIFGELIYIPLIWLVYIIFHNKKITLQSVLLLLWIIIPLIVFSLSSTKRFTYILISSPAFFILTSFFFFCLVKELKKIENRIYKALILITLFLVLVLPIRYSVERLKPFSKDHTLPLWTVQLKQLNKFEIANGVLFNYERPIEAMFYTDLTVYSQLPDKFYLDSLVAKGYQIMINNTASLPESLMHNKNKYIFINLNK
ncbi:MAG: phospholipid carrier-dependent glycosyltransferase [Bacteroidetes bacterium]|nr:phospholipid carrier-dependent glycosyltransferase [Bacteroidota bacterium]MBV6461382.1 Undecaprenyl phosphate-alpha-4-amino-4-deoxy-L-arabinose arabinosyl transferase [Flavobacteriales bacterium]MCL4816484.1 glycosyltransferase family 39 protein [Flavobacteriales bacterium]NOG94420.1 phospholipid carrier-dependent glycosyltransferase [Bacteroidota bacterium]WKZ75217.1 MAG: glycosyltransferase family 39 protein [Vicingaceae bacterium]